MSYDPREDSDDCPKCGSSDCEWEPCWQCHGDGEFDLYDEDPINYAEGEEYEMCSECGGRGGYLICYACQRAAKAAEKASHE